MSESGFKNISAAAFAKLDFETVTLIDLFVYLK